MGKDRKCAHCGGRGTSSHDCCLREAGFNRDDYIHDWNGRPDVKCCSCHGSGYVPDEPYSLGR